jgi:NTP pyrophosphatase (non-canonical NTP hydrolase)
LYDRRGAGDFPFSAYQREASATAVHPAGESGCYYLALGINGEAGEIAEVIKKMIRDGTPYAEVRAKIKKEVGDVLWYCSQLLAAFDIDMEMCAIDNLIKLASRKARGKIHGSGDDR